MLQGKVKLTDSPPTSGTVKQRAAWWGMLLVELLASNAELRQALPRGASYIVIPKNDEEVATHNFRIANAREAAGTNVVKITIGLELEKTEQLQTYVYSPSFQPPQALRV